MKLLLILITLLFANGLHIAEIIRIKIQLIEASASILPKIDTIGHNLLLKNEVIIKSILETENIPLYLRKRMVLDIIRITQYGDIFGGIVLSHYHDLVNSLL